MHVLAVLCILTAVCVCACRWQAIWSQPLQRGHRYVIRFHGYSKLAGVMGILEHSKVTSNDITTTRTAMKDDGYYWDTYNRFV